MEKSPHNILWTFLLCVFSILILVGCFNTQQNTNATVRIAFQNNHYILEECKHWMHKSCIENTFAPAKCPICKIPLLSVTVRIPERPQDEQESHR